MKKIPSICLIIMLFVAMGTRTVSADEVTADNMVPVFRLMYNVDGAEMILREKKNALNMYRENGTDIEKAMAQAAVNDAANLVNTLNVLIARNTELIAAAPAGAVNPATYAVNSMYAQTAWCDYVNKIKYPATYMNISWAENYINTNRNALINRGEQHYPLVYTGYLRDRCYR
ncbi:MAG: hypothetical protein J5910_06800 [Lachnospiraceae bacterium]|nr:hypothetical protein [Lachnospiraceae bacterium]